MSDASTVPGFLRFTWMLVMQPSSLSQRLSAAGIDEPAGLGCEASGWKLWRRVREGSAAHRAFLARLVFVPALLGVGWVALSGALLVANGVPWDWSRGALGVGLGLVAAWAGLFSREGWAGFVAFLLGGLLIGRGTATGLGLGFLVGGAANFGQHDHLGRTRFSILATTVLGLLAGSRVSGWAAAWVWAGFAAASWPLLLRVAATLVGFITQPLLYWLGRERPAATLRFSPVFWHELGLLPLPFLERHIEAAAADDPALAQRALTACALAPRQRAIGRRALRRLQAQELGEIAQAGRFPVLLEGATRWFFGTEDPATPFVQSLREAARHGLAAEGSSSPGERQEALRKAETYLEDADLWLLAEASRELELLRAALPAWRAAFERSRFAAVPT